MCVGVYVCMYVYVCAAVSLCVCVCVIQPLFQVSMGYRETDYTGSEHLDRIWIWKRLDHQMAMDLN